MNQNPFITPLRISNAHGNVAIPLINRPILGDLNVQWCKKQSKEKGKNFLMSRQEFPELSETTTDKPVIVIESAYKDKIISTMNIDCDLESNNSRPGWVYLIKDVNGETCKDGENNHNHNQNQNQNQNQNNHCTEFMYAKYANKAINEIINRWRGFVDTYAKLGRLDEYLHYYGDYYFKEDQYDEEEKDNQENYEHYSSYYDEEERF